jgi:uncharacterized protein
MIHPCQKCGACCAFYKVAFHWSETLPESHSVPIILTEKIGLHHLAMQGTNQPKPSCSALVGVIGQDIKCDIYPNRPQACRTFLPSFEDGFQNERCDRARINKGLTALSLLDWV